MSRTIDSRDKALELVDEGMVSAESMLTMALKYMYRRCRRHVGR